MAISINKEQKTLAVGTIMQLLVKILLKKQHELNNAV